MKKVESEINGELRPESDLRSLRVRTLGPGRKRFGNVLGSGSDVAEVFSNCDHAIQAAIEEKVAGLDSNRLAHECAKLDPGYEQALADEGLAAEVTEVVEY